MSTRAWALFLLGCVGVLCVEGPRTLAWILETSYGDTQGTHSAALVFESASARTHAAGLGVFPLFHPRLQTAARDAFRLPPDAATRLATPADPKPEPTPFLPAGGCLPIPRPTP